MWSLSIKRIGVIFVLFNVCFFAWSSVLFLYCSRGIQSSQQQELLLKETQIKNEDETNHIFNHNRQDEKENNKNNRREKEDYNITIPEELANNQWLRYSMERAYSKECKLKILKTAQEHHLKSTILPTPIITAPKYYLKILNYKIN